MSAAYRINTAGVTSISPERLDLMRQLTNVQHYFEHQDILSFAALLNNRELAEHIARYERIAEGL